MSSALILCGGLGTRLRPVVGDLPKALAPVDGVPFIDYLLRFLREQDIRHIVLCAGAGADQVARHCADGARWGVRIDVSREAEPLGTAGAVKLAEPFIASDPFLVLNGDSFVAADFAAAERAHSDRGGAVTMIVTEVPDTSRYGAVQCAADGAVESFVEKGRSGRGLINAGSYVVSRAVLDGVRTGVAVSLENEILPWYVGRGLYGFAVPGPFIDIGTPESFALAKQVLNKESLACHGS